MNQSERKEALKAIDRAYLSHSSEAEPVLVIDSNDLHDAVASGALAAIPRAGTASDWFIVDIAANAGASPFSRPRPVALESEVVKPSRTIPIPEDYYPLPSPSLSKTKRTSPKTIPTPPIHVHGTVRAIDTIQVRSPIDGTIDTIDVANHTWASKKTPLGFLESPQLTAVATANASDPDGSQLTSLKEVFPSISLECPSDCFLLSVVVKPQTAVRRGDVVFEAATSLKLEGNFSANDALVNYQDRHGKLQFWLSTDPGNLYEADIENLSKDSVTASLPFGVNLPPGSVWEGRFVMAPTSASTKSK